MIDPWTTELIDCLNRVRSDGKPSSVQALHLYITTAIEHDGGVRNIVVIRLLSRRHDCGGHLWQFTSEPPNTGRRGVRYFVVLRWRFASQCLRQACVYNSISSRKEHATVEPFYEIRLAEVSSATILSKDRAMLLLLLCLSRDSTVLLISFVGRFSQLDRAISLSLARTCLDAGRLFAIA